MLIRVEAGEGRAILALMAINVASGIANCLVLSAAFALFFQRFAADQLAIVYVANAGVIVAGSTAFLRLSQRFAIGAALSGLSAALAAFAWLAAILLQAGTPDWLIFALPILFQVMFVLGNLVIWNLAGRMFDVRQGRRLFGLVNTGYWIGAVGIGLAVKTLTPAMGLAGLLWPAALAASCAALGVALATRSYRARIGDAKPAASGGRSPLATALRDRHALLVFAVTACVWFAFYVIDNIFYERAHAIYADPAALAGFIGVYMAANGIVTIAITAIGSGPLIQALGVPRALLVTPILLALLCVAMASTGFTAGEGLLMFVLAATTRLADVAAMGAVNQPAMNLTYQPLPVLMRTGVQTLAEGIVQPLAIGASGLLLLWLRQGLGAQSTMLAFVALAILALWALCAGGLGASYRLRFAALLKARAYDHAADTTLPLDRDAIATLGEAARGGTPATALYAIDVLLQQAPLALLALLPDLARHPAPVVRAAILPHLANAEPELLRDLARGDAAPEVRLPALTLLAEMAGRADPVIVAALAATDWAALRAALLGMAHRSGADDTAYVADQVTRWLAGDDVAARCAALELIGAAQLAGFDDRLRDALRDADPAIRAAALTACGEWQLLGLWPDVAALLDQPRSRRAAARVLAQAGTDAVAALAAVAQDAGRSTIARADAIALLGRASGAEAARALWVLLDAADPDLRLVALQALARGGGDLDPDRAHRRAALLTQELDDAAEIAGLGRAAAAPLDTALAGSRADCKRRVLLLLGLGRDAAAMRRAIPLLAGAETKELRGRAAALELVEMWAPPALRDRILALFSAEPCGGGQPVTDVAAALLRSRPRWANDWVLACAAASLADGAAENLQSLMDTPDPALSDAVRRALARRSNETESRKEQAMVSVVERVLLLKSSNFFSGVPEALLAGIAASLEEMPVAAGATIVAEGTVEQAMYLIARGKVDVRHGAAGLAQLEAGDVFGELALLDPAPRSATVSAAEDGLLLRLDGAAFQDLLADHGEMALAIIRELVQRLRATSARLQ